jgi:hypothetical protein
LPTKDEHLDKAIPNEKLAEVLRNTTFLGWAATIFFYAALHYCEAVLAVHGHHPQSHESRDPLIRKNQVLMKIWSEYKSLDVMSRNARYYAVEITPAHIQDVRNAFDTLRAYIRRELGLS